MTVRARRRRLGAVPEPTPSWASRPYPHGMTAYGPQLLLLACALAGCTFDGAERPAGPVAAEASPVAVRCTDAMLNLYFSYPATQYTVFRERVPVVAEELQKDCTSDAQECSEAVLRAALAFTQPRGRREGEKVFDASEACVGAAGK